ncbi:KIN17-like protein [Penicillium argentinense]|uniref:KIN17-like protein n=1 Tax=Penicillium argentinense TaxID=1131581 RepID=A0A9W9G1Y8_9EURO|nr:KIN17-like protein [Penicillium argentinense]KAJ5110629.1 KIN17-like protein [Penicillium argentinense]
MPKAEAGSTKAIANAARRKGLGRLRWYCQACEKQCPDENGFKCHTQSESHVRQMMLIGEDSKSHIENYSNEFLKNFIDTLRTMHREKPVQFNHFYQNIIKDKTHIHLNSTKWKSLTHFVSYLGKEGICRVEDTEKGLFIAWIDNSPETLRKREALMKKERMDKGDEEREQKAIQQQVERAQRQAAEKKAQEKDNGNGKPEDKMLDRADGEKVKLNLGFAAKPKPETKSAPPMQETVSLEEKTADASTTAAETTETSTPAPKISMSFGAKKPQNVFAAASKKNPLAAKKGPVMVQPKKMSEAERIMKAEMEAQQRKRSKPDSGFNNKRPKISLS